MLLFLYQRDSSLLAVPFEWESLFLSLSVASAGSLNLRHLGDHRLNIDPLTLSVCPCTDGFVKSSCGDHFVSRYSVVHCSY